jgi:uncharacterized protein YycO
MDSNRKGDPMLRRFFLRPLIGTLMTILAFTIVFFVNGFFEYAVVNGILEDFRSRGEYIETIGNISYYRVKPIYDYEDIEDRYVFNYHQSYPYIGSKGDIILTNRNPMRRDPLLSAPVGFLSYYFYVGHATINGDDEGDLLIESVGNDSVNNGVRLYVPNDWFYQGSDTPSIVGLRVKYATPDEIDQAVEYTIDKLGLPYNFSFVFNRKNSYYCTDLVSRAYAHVGYNTNYDYFGTTGNDMIMSKNTYVIFHRNLVYIDGEVHYNIYFLSEGDDL